MKGPYYVPGRPNRSVISSHPVDYKVGGGTEAAIRKVKILLLRAPRAKEAATI
jgi:hypothetical protein